MRIAVRAKDKKSRLVSVVLRTKNCWPCLGISSNRPVLNLGLNSRTGLCESSVFHRSNVRSTWFISTFSRTQSHCRMFCAWHDVLSVDTHVILFMFAALSCGRWIAWETSRQLEIEIGWYNSVLFRSWLSLPFDYCPLIVRSDDCHWAFMSVG